MDIDIGISRSMTPEMEKYVQAAKIMQESGEMDFSNVITAYDIIFFILFLLFAVPFIVGLFKEIHHAIDSSKKVRRANGILDALSDVGSTNQAVDMDAILQAISDQSRPQRTSARRTTSANKQFDNIARQIQKTIELQRRQT